MSSRTRRSNGRVDVMAERQCIVTRELGSSQDLLRLVADPQGRIVADLKGILPGRGVWLTPRRDIVQEAIKTRAFSGSLRCDIEPQANLVDDIDHLLESSALGALSMCRKAGQCVMGASQVKSSLSKGVVKAVLYAVDGSDSEYEKLCGSCRANDVSNIWRLFTSSQHDSKLGTSNTVHIGLLSGPLTEHLVAKLSLLMKYRCVEERSIC